MNTCHQNLKEAFSGESQVNCLYLAFARQAEEEGYPEVARLFRAAAEAETIHALAHLRALKVIGTTEENLRRAIHGETSEYEKIYPKMIAAARQEGHREAELSLTRAKKVERGHAILYKKALANLGRRENQDYYVCCACGYTCENEPPKKCPVCRGPGQTFSQAG